VVIDNLGDDCPKCGCKRALTKERDRHRDGLDGGEFHVGERSHVKVVICERCGHQVERFLFLVADKD